jgi:hypothetical protein
MTALRLVLMLKVAFTTERGKAGRNHSSRTILAPEASAERAACRHTGVGGRHRALASPDNELAALACCDLALKHVSPWIAKHRLEELQKVPVGF